MYGGELMAYYYQVIPAMPMGGVIETIQTTTPPTLERLGHDEAAEIYAARWPDVTVTLKFKAPTGREMGLNYYKITRRGYEPLTIIVTVL